MALVRPTLGLDPATPASLWHASQRPAPGVCEDAFEAAAGVALLAALTAFLLIFGVYPMPLLRLGEHAVSTLPWP